MIGGRQQFLLLQHPADRQTRATRASARPLPEHSRQAKHLWICLYFSKLPMEVIGNSEKPKAVMAASGRQPRIMLCNGAAAGFGLRSGMHVNAALALMPDLECVKRDLSREHEALEMLASWAMRYTPSVSIESGLALLLDVQASLKIFGGLPALRRLIAVELAAQPYRATLSSATTAVAALWLARAGCADTGADTPASGGTGVPARLATLPVECTGWPNKTLQTLAQMGVQTVGECMRLPRDGFARRIGAGHLRELDLARGLRPEIRRFYRPPKYFRATLELPGEICDAGLLLQSTRDLLGRLDTFLVTHQGGIEMLWIRLYHLDRPATLLRIGLLEVVAESSGLPELIRLRFADLKFAAPVIALAFEARLVSLPPPDSMDLFGDRADGGRQERRFFERLCARLGSGAVHGIRPVPEHRPESAWERVSSASEGKSKRIDSGYDGIAARRPLWMLGEPQLLRVVSGQPVFHDVLNLEGGPERIETGWWDGNDIRRDYYVARNLRGTRLWIFEDRRASRWYLHGLFG